MEEEGEVGLSQDPALAALQDGAYGVDGLVERGL